MHYTRRIVTLVLAVGLLLGGLAAVGEAGGTIRIATHLDSLNLTPYNYVTGTPGYRKMTLVYDSLLYGNADNIPQPWLAETAELSEDGLVWTFKLHEGIEWHDGEPFTAYDVKFTYEYYRQYPMGRFLGPIERAVDRVWAVDDYTVVMYLKQADPAFRFDLVDIPILPMHIWKDITDPDNALDPAISIGTGPYKLVTWREAELYRFESNPGYFKGEPRFDTIIMPVILDQTAMFTALKVGEIDATTLALTAELVAGFEAVDGLEIATGPGFRSTILVFNNELYPLDIREFRQALAYAVDPQDLADTLLLGYGAVGNMGYYHPATPWFNPATEQYEQDFDAANAILDNLGFFDVDGDGMRETPAGEQILLPILCYSGRPLRIRSAEIISAWFAEIGVNAPAQAMDFTSLDNLVWPGFDVREGRDYAMAMWGWSPSSMFTPWGPTKMMHSDPDDGWLNIVAFSDPDVDEVCDRMFTTGDQVELEAIVDEFQVLVADGVPFITLFYGDQIFAYWADAHDAWVFRKGEGIHDKLSMIDQGE